MGDPRRFTAHFTGPAHPWQKERIDDEKRIMREYGLYLHTKMSRTLYHYLGDPHFHKRLLTDALEAQGII